MYDKVGLRSGKCPLCGSDKVYENSEVGHGHSGHLIIKGGILKYRQAKITHYCCVDCGCLETYLENSGDRKMVASKSECISERMYHISRLFCVILYIRCVGELLYNTLHNKYTISNYAP